MSRIGLNPIQITEGVVVKFDGNSITVIGHRVELTKTLHQDNKNNLEDNAITFERPRNHKAHRALHGTTRSLISNMIEGVHKGFEKQLEIIGVGYRAQKQGDKTVINAGYSHPVEVEQP